MERRPRRRRRTPPTDSGAAPRPGRPERKPLREMTPAELRAWLAAQQCELEDFATYAQAWRLGREERHIHTLNDDRYDRFLDQAADLIRGLAELYDLVEEPRQQESEEEHEQ